MEPVPPSAPANLDHFIRLARAGKFPGASAGEKIARHIALAVINRVGSLDPSALEGFKKFVDVAALLPTEAKTLIK